MIELQINGIDIKATEGEKLIQVCDREGIDIPRFCYHKNLSIAANCRMCLVQVDGIVKPQPACSTVASSGMKVWTNNKDIKKSQQAVMELLLINHPLDCPICDQGGECELQDVAINYGSNISHYNEDKRVVLDSDIGPLIQTDMTRCIHCTRCVRFGSEIVGITEIGVIGRGEHMQISTFLNNSIDSELSGNMIDICPVGALTSKPFRFQIRAWQMQQYDNIATHDLVGSNVSVHINNNKVYRVSARENTNINQTWISDKDRFSYEALNSYNRLVNPQIKIAGKWQEVSWEVALDFAVKGLKNSVIINNNTNKLATLASVNSTLEELYLLKKFTNAIGSTNIEHRLNIKNLSNYSYLDSNITIEELANVDEILIIGANPRLEQVMLNHRLRQASLAGAKVSVIAVKNIILNYKINKLILASTDEFSKKITTIKLKSNSVIIVGEQINFANNINKINQAIMGLVNKFGSKILNISSNANTLAAKKIDFVSTKNISNMSAYILFGLDENFDFIDKDVLKSLYKANFVISFNSFKNVNKFSDVILPIAILYENCGSFINIDYKVQYFNSSIKPYGNAKKAWKIIKVLADMLELNSFNFDDNEQVAAEAILVNSAKQDTVVDTEKEIAENNEIKVIYQTNAYNSDIILRNAASLQQTIIAKENYAYMNKQTANKLNLDNNYNNIPIMLEKYIADNCIVVIRNKPKEVN